MDYLDLPPIAPKRAPQSGDFAIEYFTGKHGWLKSSERFPTMSAAEIEAVNQVRRERRAELTPIMRRGAKI